MVGRSSRALALPLVLVWLTGAFAACGGSSADTKTDTGGASGTGGAGQGGTGGTSGKGAGTGGTTGGAKTCDELGKEVAAELAKIQHCETWVDCGTVLKGTSCGCTRDLVARDDADTTRFYELVNTPIEGQTCNLFSSTCDCPDANDYACVDGKCTWNYTGTDPEPVCSPAPIGQLCVLGNPIDSGDALSVGMPLTVQLRPAGCLSSSCTTVVSASCKVMPDVDDFIATADICLGGPADPTMGCTGDCGDVGRTDCSSDLPLAEGTHTVRYDDGDVSLHVTFTVPSIVTDNSLCDGKPF